MSSPAGIALYNTWKEQISTPVRVCEIGKIICHGIEKYYGQKIATVSKVQELIDSTRNLSRICNFTKNLFESWEFPSISQLSEAVKSACDVIPTLFLLVNRVNSATLKYFIYPKILISFVQSSESLKSSVESMYSSSEENQIKKLNTIQNLLDELKTVDGALQNSMSYNGNSLYEACRKLHRLVLKIDNSADSDQHEVLGVLNRMILNSSEINTNLSRSEISKLKEIIKQSMEKEYSLESLNTISDQFKSYLKSYHYKSETKSLLEVLKCAISWILNTSGMLELFFLGFGLSGTALFCLEICSFIIRFSISFYKNYLINM